MRNLAKDFLQGMIKHQLALFKIVAILLVVVVLAGVAVKGASYSSKSCTVCHYIEPYYKQWETSSHNDVRCVKCHPYPMTLISANILQYLTNTYDPRPRAEVEDAVCLQEGCHTERLVDGKVVFKENILFDHNAHVGKLQREKRLRCTSCHSQIVQGEHLAVTEKVCFLCHFKGADRGQAVTACPSCHGIPKKEVEHEGFVFTHESYMEIGVACDQCHLDVAAGTGDVPRERCYSCHVERTERYEDTVFIHDVHVAKHGVYCLQCHTEIRHGQIQMAKSLEIQCESCHVKLHGLQKEMYMGVSGKGVHDTPSRMFAAQVSCDGCHTHVVSNGELGSLAIGEKSLEAERKSCVVCHGEGYDTMLDEWLTAIHDAVATFKTKLEAAEAVLKRHRDEGRELGEAETLMADARYNFEMVNFGKGAHNVEYAVNLLKAAADQIDVAMKYLDDNSKPMDRDRLLGTPDGYCSILCHERVGVPEEIHFAEMKHDFPHQLHAEDIGIECTTCHSPDKHKMRIISRDECMNCHHQDQQIDCRHCHNEQDTVFRGIAEGYGLAEDIPGTMSEAIECVDCHDLEAAAPLLTAMRGKCIECHDEESYGDMLIEWERDSQESLDDFAVLLAQARAGLDRTKHTVSNLEELEAAYEQAKHIGDTIEGGSAVHNVEYADAMLEAAKKKLESIITQTQP
jgi:hypothetical protein